MKKTRINLAEKYPKYFAATKRTEKLAELTDEQAETLDKVEAHMTELEDELTAVKEELNEAKAEDKEEEEENTETDNSAAEDKDEEEENKASVDLDQKIASLEATVTKLQGIIDQKPGANATNVKSDTTSEGGSLKKDEKKKMASSVDKELDRLLGIKS